MKSATQLTKFSYDQIPLMQSYIKALEDDLFAALIKRNKIPEQLAKKYTHRLMDCVDDIKNCQSCQALSCCKNTVEGHFLSPVVSQRVINFSYRPCHFFKQEQYKENLILFDIPKSLKSASMKDVYRTDKTRIPILKELKKFIDEYKKGSAEKGIYLHGSFGSGKTYLICALFNELAKDGVQSVIVHVPELLRNLKDSFATNYSDKFELLRKTPLLLLDDIGAEYLTPWGRDEVIEPILQYRMDEGLPTFFTSNFSQEQLEKHFSNTANSIDLVKAKRIIERIQKLSCEMSLVGKDLRK